MPADLAFYDVACGCGGLAKGFQDAGYSCVGAFDADADAVATFRLNVSPLAEVALVQTTHLEKDSFDCLVAGLPCEGFSTLGKRDPDHPKNRLWWHFVRLLREAKPTAFLVENVPPFLHTQRFRLLKARAEDLGYTVGSGVLDAVCLGVAQRRRRAFVVGGPTAIELPLGDDEVLTVRDAMGDLPLAPDGKNDHEPRRHLPVSLRRYPHVPPGGDRFDLPTKLQNPCWIATPKGARGVFGRLKWDEPADTIRTTFLKPECGRYIHPEAHRGLTIREGARLQGFRDDFRFCDGSKSTQPSSDSRARLIGRAVPPPVAFALAQVISDAL